VVQTLQNGFQAVRTALRGFLRHQPGVVVTQPGVKPPLKAGLTVTVRRFQGKYECGCPADPLNGPEICEIHEKPRWYVLQYVKSEISREG
jgi:hypothetical protein